MKMEKLGRIVLSTWIIPLVLILNGCEKECVCEEAGTPIKTNTYYVKYVFDKSTIYLKQQNNISIKNENGAWVTYEKEESGYWTTTIGPVEKGFYASMYSNPVGATHNKLKLKAYIEVSKNGEPFVIKNSDLSNEPRDEVSIGYVVN